MTSEPDGAGDGAISAYDAIVVGGGPAGLSAALWLGRCRRRVLVCDTGQPRNAASHALHGFLGHDGIDPGELRGIGRDQLRQYETVELRDVEVADAMRSQEQFEVVAAAEGAQAAFAINTALLKEDLV